MGDFLAELLADAIIGPLLNLMFRTVWWLLRTGTWLLLYPLLLLTGWVRLWVRERGQTSFLRLWQRQGRAGLHRFGRAEAALDGESAIASCLIVLAAAGVSLVLYSLAQLWFL